MPQRTEPSLSIYHLHAQLIRRSQGRSAVASAAYRSAQRLYDERLGRTHSYVAKEGVVYRDVLIPEGAPAWSRDRGTLWNAVEASETRRDAQVAREVRVALPVELSVDGQIALIRTFAREQFTCRGMVADVAIHHDNPANPHAHIGLTLRPLTESGFGPKARAWNSRTVLMDWRAGWEHACNRALARAGHEARVDHRSHADRGLRLEPTCKVGMATASGQDSRQDLVRERVAHNEAVRAANGAAILRDPTVAMEALTAHEATFTHGRLVGWLERQTSNHPQRNACVEAVMASPEVRQVGRTQWGENVYSSREMLESEWALMRLGRKMVRDPTSTVPAGTWKSLTGASELSLEQQSALRQVTEGRGRLAVVEGWAGTGKSYLLGVAREAWAGQGLRVVGGALSGRAAAGLGDSAGISESRTLASWEHAWRRGEARLGRRDVLVIDEASLVGTRQMGRVLQEAEHGGAKVVLVGDTRQLQAIEAGSPMRALGQVAGQAVLRDIRRQALPWQQEASAALAAGRVGEALSAYRKDVHPHEVTGAAPAAIAEAWVARERESAPLGDASQVALTHRRSDVAMLNQAIRQARREAGLLAPTDCEVAVETPRGKRQMAAGDRVCFLRNDRQLGVYNGTTGTVLKGPEGTLRVRLDSGRRLTVPLERYSDLDHGYALTVHKAQGVTVDHAYVWATPGLDRHATYVAMTRHRLGLSVHFEREDFSGRGGLEACLSRSRPKGMAMAFAAAETERRGRQRAASDARREAETAMVAHREEILKAYATARSEVVKLRATCEQQVPSVSEAMTGTSAYLEGQRRLQNAERVLGAWRDLQRETAAQHPVRAQLGLIRRVQVMSPETGRPVRLDEGLEMAHRRHVQAEKALAAKIRSPDLLREAEGRVEAARESQARALERLPVLKARAREASAALDVLDRTYPNLAKTHVLTQHGHVCELKEIRVQDQQTRLEARCRRLTALQERLEHRTSRLLQGRLESREHQIPSKTSGRSPGLVRQGSRLRYRYDREIERLKARVMGIRAGLERATQGMTRVRDRGRDRSCDLSR
jgi:Ti-type conjugative transfer relaxase TraA